VEHVERAAHHGLRGEAWDKAVLYLRQAGGKAMERSAYGEAAASFEQALAVEAQPSAWDQYIHEVRTLVDSPGAASR
jgi:predicted ATPase